jgi:hypothetical protein
VEAALRQVEPDGRPARAGRVEQFGQQDLEAEAQGAVTRQVAEALDGGGAPREL